MGEVNDGPARLTSLNQQNRVNKKKAGRFRPAFGLES
jgi:hypothetical protein